jgi:hypothetical protein
LTSIELSGACTSADAIPVQSVVGDVVPIGASSAGDCHFVLGFATGFTYSGDVEFTANDGECNCPPYLTPMVDVVAVDNPPTTCADEPADGAADEDAQGGDGGG